MLRTSSVSTMSSNRDDMSSVVTGNSVQMAIEGQWDESVSIQDIHDGIVKHLSQKLEHLKKKYRRFKTTDDRLKDRVVKKIVAARIQYQRYVNVTRDILQRCQEFMTVRKDSPGSRIAFMRNVQTYFQQARDFVKMDITLKKMSPTLLSYVQPKATDSPATYRRKRELCNSMFHMFNAERPGSQNPIGKLFRSKYVQHNRFLHKEFPLAWAHYLPNVLKKVLLHVSDSDQRWMFAVLYLFSKHCSANYVQQGFCPTCLFPIVNRSDQGTVGGKLFCPACRKEIEWTYYMNPRTICHILSSFHSEEIQRAMNELEEQMLSEPGSMTVVDGWSPFEDILTEYLTNGSVYLEVDSAHTRSGSKTQISEEGGTVASEEPPRENSGSECENSEGEPVRRGSASGFDPKVSSLFPPLSQIIIMANQRLQQVYGPEASVDVKNAKDTYHIYRGEIMSFEGNCSDSIPRGIVPRVERYVCHYYKLPPKEEIRKLPLNQKGDREGTSRKMISDALNELSLSQYTHLVTKIAHKIWGSQLPSLSTSYLEILTDCVLQKEVFNRLSSTHGRKSNLNQRLILFFITQRYGYPWTEEDFRVSFSSTTLNKQLAILRDIFQLIDSPGS